MRRASHWLVPTGSAGWSKSTDLTAQNETMSFHRLNLRLCQFHEARNHYVNTTKHAAHMKSLIWLDKPNQKTALATPKILLCTLQLVIFWLMYKKGASSWHPSRALWRVYLKLWHAHVYQVATDECLSKLTSVLNDVTNQQLSGFEYGKESRFTTMLAFAS